MTRSGLGRRALAELLGTGLLVAVVVGSGIAAQRLSPDDIGLQLLEERGGANLWLSEVVATTGLLLVIFCLARSGQASSTPAAVGAYIGAAYFFTASTSFANPAVTIGRAFTDTFAGIEPGSVAGFLLAQLGGLGVALLLVVTLYPRRVAVPEAEGDVVFPQLVPR